MIPISLNNVIVSNFFISFILCSAPHDNGASAIRRRMREQHELDSDSEVPEDVEDVASQYFVSSMLVHVASCL